MIDAQLRAEIPVCDKGYEWCAKGRGKVLVPKSDSHRTYNPFEEAPDLFLQFGALNILKPPAEPMGQVGGWMCGDLKETYKKFADQWGAVVEKGSPGDCGTPT
jgi:hypothetical protein